MVRRLSFFILAAIALAATPAFAKPKATVIHDFGSTSADGYSQPSLISDGAGNLFGTLIYGGQFGHGVVFKMDQNGVETIIYSFSGGTKDGAEPSSLTIDSKGNLYGTTEGGGVGNAGTVFQLKPKKNGTWKESVIYGFCSLTNCADGNEPIGAVTIGPKGSLFGTTSEGGTGGITGGVIFRLDPTKGNKALWSETVLYNFCSQANCADGYGPQRVRLVLTTSGTLFGTAAYGPGFDNGTLYALNLDGSGFHVLHSFAGDSSDGGRPITGVVADSNGVLYGTTFELGANFAGIVYSFDPSSSAYQQIYVAPGQKPAPAIFGSDLAVVQNGKSITLYGVSLEGGANGPGIGNGGALYSLQSPKASGGSWTEKTLYSFCNKPNCADGETPNSLVDIDGVLYGTTWSGGAVNRGVAFRFGE